MASASSVTLSKKPSNNPFILAQLISPSSSLYSSISASRRLLEVDSINTNRLAVASVIP